METPAPVPELLLAALEGLVIDYLKRFQWHLTMNVLDGLSPIPKGCLENADRQDTVREDDEGAVKISLEILRKINQNDLAIKLERDTLGKVLAIKKDCI